MSSIFLSSKTSSPPLSQKTWQCLCYEPLESDVKILCFQKYVYLISQLIKTTNEYLWTLYNRLVFLVLPTIVMEKKLRV